MPVFPQSMSDFKPGETNIKSVLTYQDSYSGYRCVQIRNGTLCGLKSFVFSDLTRDIQYKVLIFRFFKWKQAKHPVGCEEMKTPANSNNF